MIFFLLLTFAVTFFSGCPLSRHWKEHFTDYRLSYNAREIACHAQEIFSKRLINKDYFYLKVFVAGKNIARIATFVF